MDKIRDIKPDALIFDVSFYILALLVFFGGLVTIFVIFVVIKHFKKKIKSEKYIAKKQLKNIDFTNSKKAAYAITKYAFFVAENPHQKEFLDELERELVKYKYKKEVVSFKAEDKKKFKEFMEICGV